MKRKVEARLIIEIEVDENKFTDEFQEEFAECIGLMESIDEHIEHLACLFVEVENCHFDDHLFVEGYGDLSEMGIKAELLDSDYHLLPEEPT